MRFLVRPSLSRFAHRCSIGACAGLFLGLLGGVLFAAALHVIVSPRSWSSALLAGLSLLFFSIFGIHIGRRLETHLLPAPPAMPDRSTPFPKLVDTSAIIDGRIADLCATGFLEGPFLLSQCVLRELHILADSAQAWKRVRGKRGLEILQKLQQLPGMEFRLLDDLDPDIPEVDAKLVARARAHRAKLITNDWNLNKIASLQGVTVLNVNELCHRLQPALLPGDTIRVHLFKEGQARDQAIAHLDDGTMVVVEQAKALIGSNVDVRVTGLHQTQSGRMVFGTVHEQPEDRRRIHASPTS